jgi:hypothetical protein
MIDEWWSEKDLEGSESSLTDVLSRHVPGENEENHENLGQGSQFPGQDSKQAPPEHESRVLPQHQPAR